MYGVEGLLVGIQQYTSCELRYVLVDVGRSIVFSDLNYFIFPFFPFNLMMMAVQVESDRHSLTCPSKRGIH